MRVRILCVTGALIAAGCSHSKQHETIEQVRQQPPAAEAETQGGRATTGGDPNCPMQVSGTTLRTEDSSDGAVMVFLTSGDVPELRVRVRNLAAMHNRMQSAHSSAQNSPSSGPPANSIPGSGMYDTQGSGAPGGGSLGSTDGNSYSAAQPTATGMPSSTARAADIEGGAQLILIATDPSQSDALRASVRDHAQDMASGQCSSTMAQGGMQNGTQQTGTENRSTGY